MATTTVNELTQLKDRIAKLQEERDKAKGALEQVLGRIRKEFGCKTLEEARHKLKQLAAAADTAEDKFETELAQFKTKYGDQL